MIDFSFEKRKNFLDEIWCMISNEDTGRSINVFSADEDETFVST
jgi:hypothetical protein